MSLPRTGPPDRPAIAKESHIHQHHGAIHVRSLLTPHTIDRLARAP